MKCKNSVFDHLVIQLFQMHQFLTDQTPHTNQDVATPSRVISLFTLHILTKVYPHQAGQHPFSLVTHHLFTKV